MQGAEFSALFFSALLILQLIDRRFYNDSLNPDYAFHFNNPNPTGLGTTQAGGA